MVAIVSDETNAVFQEANSKIQRKLVGEIDKLIRKRCAFKRTRSWAVWPSGGNIPDALRVVDALRDEELVTHGANGICKVLSLHLCLKVSPQPENVLDKQLSMVCQSVMQRLAERSSGAVELHTKTQGLKNARYSRGFGLCFTDRPLFLKAVDDIKQMLCKLSPAPHFSPSTSISESE